MQVSKSGYYKWYLIKDSKEKNNILLEEEIKKIHASSRGTYGRKRVLSTLKKSFINVGKKIVSKIIHKLELNGIGKPKYRITTKLDAKASC